MVLADWGSARISVRLSDVTSAWVYAGWSESEKELFWDTYAPVGSVEAQMAGGCRQCESCLPQIFTAMSFNTSSWSILLMPRQLTCSYWVEICLLIAASPVLNSHLHGAS